VGACLATPGGLWQAELFSTQHPIAILIEAFKHPIFHGLGRRGGRDPHHQRRDHHAAHREGYNFS
jgi:hypothetical protein